MTTSRYDLVVVGAGSGGIGAAVAAGRLGMNVLLLERADTIGGTATRGGVHCWEPGVGGTGIPFEIYRLLRRTPDAVGITTGGRSYMDTLRRYGGAGLDGEAAERFRQKHWHSVVFEPDAYLDVVGRMLARIDTCEVRVGVSFTGVVQRDSRISRLLLNDGSTVDANAFIDATGQAALVRAAGGEVMTGQEGRSTFGETGAPEEATAHLNGVSLCYRVDPGTEEVLIPPGQRDPRECWWSIRYPVPSVRRYPRGGYNMNMLPTMEGAAAAVMDPREAYDECVRRVYAHWVDLKSLRPQDRPSHVSEIEFGQYHLSWIAPALGVREGPRVLTEHVLTEQDLLSGMTRSPHADVVAIADHAMDTHGSSTGRAGCAELNEPYGIPYRCMIPRGWRNLLVSCRGAGFSSRAASSCRLSRTMIQLGQAAGTAVALASGLGCDLPAVPPEMLRDSLRAQHAQVDWPMTDELRSLLEAGQ